MIETATLLMSLLAPPPLRDDSWEFQVFLDQREIGHHRFELTQDAGQWRLLSEAEFSVNILFFNAYRYEHRSEEYWDGSCLQQIDATTNDDGERFTVRGQYDGSGFRLTSPGQALDGCVMTFAYWNPALVQQDKLLNVQTGEFLPVEITALNDSGFSYQAQPGQLGFRIQAMKKAQPLLIDVWYDATGDWIALDALVEDDRVLRYRRQNSALGASL